MLPQDDTTPNLERLWENKGRGRSPEGQETELLILMLTDTVSNPTEALEITQSACS
jgi:hypothetical protein